MNMNDINATGIYTLSGSWTNSPRGADSYVATGLLLHMHRRHNAGPISWQLCVLQTYENIVFYRFNNGGAWSTWFKMAQDGGVVHKTGDEEIAGQKTFQNLIAFKTVNEVLKIIHPSMDGAVIPDTSLFSHFSFYDKNNKRQAFIQLSDRLDGRLELELVLNNGSSDVVKDERIKIGYNKSTKSFYTVAPTPVTGSNDNSIATTGWVTQKVNSNKLTIGNPVSQGTSWSGSCTKNTIVYINSSGAVHDVKVNGTKVANTSGYHGEQPQCVTILVPAGGSWSIGSAGNGSITSVLYMEIN